jgi:phosphatidylserine/phosphatidylglycerophosphate/cardiolipin synthase-like enzyme
MSSQHLTAFERRAVAGLASDAGLAAALLDAWANLPETSSQTVRSLIDSAQLGVTEERAAEAVLKVAINLGLVEATDSGFRPKGGSRERFKRLAFALNAVDYYTTDVHRDATIAQVVLTKPPRPSILEQRLSELGWRTADLEPTDHAFHSMVAAAQNRVVVMTPFFDLKGAAWLQELLCFASAGVDRALVLRSLEDPSRKDYPVGFDAIAPWLQEQRIRVFNYSIPRVAGGSRETFHAKVVLCDRSAAYLGSSNLTAASLEHSMEMGVVLRGRAASGVAEVVDAVIAASTPFA